MKRVIFGIVAAVIVVAALFGVGGMAYRMGVAQGAGYAALNLPRGDVAPPAVEGQPNFGRGYTPGYPMPMMPSPYYGHGFGRMGGFNPFGGLLGILGTLFLIFLFFGLIRAVFFRRMGWGMHGGWRGHGEVPPWVMEWHRKMHEAQPGSAQTPGPKPDGEPQAAA
jgi:hypothetical protein